MSDKHIPWIFIVATLIVTVFIMLLSRVAVQDTNERSIKRLQNENFKLKYKVRLLEINLGKRGVK